MELVRNIILTSHRANVPKIKKGKRKEKSKLSFALDEKRDHHETASSSKRGRGEEDGECGNLAVALTEDSVRTSKLFKNPNVDTSFLPDREREDLERIERENLRKEWLAEQERIKAEDIEITYSYWDGSGHRKAVEVSSRLAAKLNIHSARRATTSPTSSRNVGISFLN